MGAYRHLPIPRPPAIQRPKRTIGCGQGVGMWGGGGGAGGDAWMDCCLNLAAPIGLSPLSPFLPLNPFPLCVLGGGGVVQGP